MTTTHTTEQALATVKAEQARWQALVEAVGSDRWATAEVAGNWTFADIAGHLTAWFERRTKTLEALANGEAGPLAKRPWPDELDDVGSINAWIYAKNRDRPANELVAESSAIYERLIAAIERIPEEKLNAPDIFPWQNDEPFTELLINGNFFEHLRDEHEAEIKSWVESNSVGG